MSWSLERGFYIPKRKTRAYWLAWGLVMLDNGKLGIGVVGLGLVANEHIKGYISNPDCEIVAFFSRDEERAKLKAEQLGLSHCRPYDDLDTMLKQDEIDLV